MVLVLLMLLRWMRCACQYGGRLQQVAVGETAPLAHALQHASGKNGGDLTQSDCNFRSVVPLLLLKQDGGPGAIR